MKSAYSSLMYSKFFNPAFNSAIFDGPFRIYFAQFHESFALKVYFYLQQKLPLEILQIKDSAKKSGRQVLIMVYPSKESFMFSFEGHNLNFGPISVDKFNEDIVVGLCGPLEDEQLDIIVDAVIDSTKVWTQVASQDQLDLNTSTSSSDLAQI